MQKKSYMTDVCVWIIIAILTLFYLQEVRLSGSLTINQSTLINMGANFAPLTFGKHQYIRIVMAMWLHMSLLHILSNCFSLYIFSRITDQVYNWFEFLLIYLLAGLGGDLISVIMSPNVISAGASTAVMGTVGAMLAIFFAPHDMFNTKQVAEQSIFLLILNTVLAGPGIDVWGHAGGFVVGFIVATVFILIKRVKWHYQRKNNYYGGQY